MTQTKDQMRADFEAWWESDGQFVRSGGGDYEKTFAFSAWQVARASAPPGVPKAWATHHDEPMLFPTEDEARLYCDDDELPIPLYAHPPSSKE